MASGTKIAFSAGELSGDEHAAALLSRLRQLDPGLVARGMGGRNLSAKGMELVVDAERSASVMGFQELFGSIGKVLSALSAMKRLVSEWRPDVLVLVDFADFNMRLAAHARKEGIKVVYYITPQVWAWRSGRVRAIRRNVDLAVVLFPFEEEFFRKNGFDRARFLGHPFADHLRFPPLGAEERAALLRRAGLDPARPVVALFPGSRRSELERHLKPMLEGIEILRRAHPEIQAVVAAAPSVSPDTLKKLSPPGLSPSIFDGTSIELLRAADAGILKSGTSNLQAVFCGLPFTMFYIASALTSAIVRTIVRVKQYSIVNILRPDTVRELVQENATPENVAKELERLLFESAEAAKMREAFREIVDGLTYRQGEEGEDCCLRAARAILALADQPRT